MSNINQLIHLHYTDVISRYLQECADDAQAEAILHLGTDLRKYLDVFPASIRWHHIWPGGLGDHIGQVIALASEHNTMLSLGLKQEDIVLVGLVHDWNKIKRYDLRGDRETSLLGAVEHPAFKYDQNHLMSTAAMMAEIGNIACDYGIHLSPEIINGIEMCEGGWSDTARTNPAIQMSNLACVIHSADLISAKAFKDQGYFATKEWEWTDLSDTVEEARIDIEEEFLP